MNLPAKLTNYSFVNVNGKEKMMKFYIKLFAGRAQNGFYRWDFKPDGHHYYCLRQQ